MDGLDSKLIDISPKLSKSLSLNDILLMEKTPFMCRVKSHLANLEGMRAKFKIGGIVDL